MLKEELFVNYLEIHQSYNNLQEIMTQVGVKITPGFIMITME